jgi:hypothetical protein
MLFQSLFRRAGLLVVLAVAACDAHNPAASSVALAPEPTVPAVRAEAVLLGSYAAPNSMPQPGDITSYVPHSSTGLVLKPNTYTLIRISGTLQAERNPFLPGALAGQIAASYTPVESSESTAGGNTNIWLHRSGAALPPPAGGAQRISYDFRPDAAGRDRILLVRTGAEGFEVWSQRDRMPGADLLYGYCQPGHPYCTSEQVVQPDSAWLKERVWIEDFWVVQSHVVTATELPEPLALDGPAVIAPGATMSVTARPWGDLRFRDLNGQSSDVRWFWYPNDTTGTPPLPPRSICSGKPLGTCEYSPTESGRLHAWAHVEGALVETNKIVRVRKEQFELKCNGAQDSVRITRADELNCEVSGATDITGWEFRADNSGYQNPAAGGTPIKGTEWKGRVVLSGTVTVTARVAGAEESKSVRVRVEAREWSGMTMPRSISEEPNTHLPLRPDSLHDLGDIHQGMELEFKGMDKWAPIFDGPNANLAYLVKAPAEYTALVHVNRAALSRDSDFWKAQYTRQRSSGVVDCLQREANITGFIPVILRHEGIGFDPKSHAYLYVTTADRVGNPLYERVVGSTLQELADQSAAVREMAHDSAVAATALADSPGYRPTWCRFHFNYRSR